MDTTLSVDKIQRLIVDYEGGARTSIFVPNVSWGYFKSHEADLLRISKQGYLTEYEIKRSWSDFLADFKKDGTHFEGKVAHLYYVVPESIKDKCWEFLMQHQFPEPYLRGRYDLMPPVGLMYYTEHGIMYGYKRAPHLARYTRSNDNDYKLYLEEQMAIMRLGLLRLWTRQAKEPTLNLE